MKHIKYDSETKQFMELREVYHLDEGGFKDEYQLIPPEHSLNGEYQQYKKERLRKDRVKHKAGQYFDLALYAVYSIAVVIVIMGCVISFA
jgi:hypothetical protein